MERVELQEAVARAIYESDCAQDSGWEYALWESLMTATRLEYELNAAAAIRVVLAEAERIVRELDGDSFYEEDGGLIAMGTDGFYVARGDVLAALVPPPPV